MEEDGTEEVNSQMRDSDGSTSCPFATADEVRYGTVQKPE